EGDVWGHLTDEPQTGTGERIAIGRLFAGAGWVVHARSTVADLAVGAAIVAPEPHPPDTAAVADDVRREFVRDQHQVLERAIGQAVLAAMKQRRGAYGGQ